jgi:hypothetical protein
LRQRPCIQRALTAVLVVGACAIGGSGWAATAGPANRPRQASITQVITLITGDRAAITTARSGLRAAGLRVTGLRVTTVVPSSSQPGLRSFQTFSTGGATLLLPVSALPYLGNGLSPTLFNVAELQRAERDGRIPVQIAFAGKLPALPGIRVTSEGPRSAVGYLTPASALRFGAALDRLRRTDQPNGSYGTRGIFAGGLTIGLAGQPGTTRMRMAALDPGGTRTSVFDTSDARPGFPMQTLTIKATDRFGAPDTGDIVEVGNADNSSYFDAIAVFYKGVAKLSVPVGHYWAIGEFFDFFDLRDPVSDWRFVIAPQFTVRGSKTTIRLRETSAYSEIATRTPRPTVQEDTTFDLWRFGHSGPLVNDSYSGTGVALWLNPTRTKPTVGKQWMFIDQQLVSPAKARGTPYEYDLADAELRGLIPAQHFTIRAATLAVVNARYFQDVRSTGGLSRIGIFPQQSGQFVFAPLIPFQLPRHQLEYMAGSRSIQWSDLVTEVYGPSIGGQQDVLRLFRPGERLNENWNAYPLSPQPNVNLTGAADLAPVQPSAVRSGNTLDLDLNPFSDNQPGHAGPGFGGGRYRIDDNGRRVAGGPLSSSEGPTGVVASARLPGRPSQVTLTLVATRPAAAFPLSPGMRVVWTWRSARQPRTWLPKGWTCSGIGLVGLPSGGRHCAAQPMMMLRYVVAGLGLNGRTRAGRQDIGIYVGQLPLARVARITGLTVLVSINGGRTWRPARVKRTGASSFRAEFKAPAGSFVALRVRATDAAAGSVTETIQRGYQVGRATGRSS